MPAAAAGIVDDQIPLAADVDLSGAQIRRPGVSRFGENAMCPLRHDLIIARLHLTGCNANACSAFSIAAAHGDSGFVPGEVFRNFLSRDVQRLGIPADR